MREYRKFFSDEVGKSLTQSARVRLLQLEERKLSFPVPLAQLISAIDACIEYGITVDPNIQLNVETLGKDIGRGNQMLDSLESTVEGVEHLIVVFYKVLLELDLSVAGTLGLDSRAFLDFVDLQDDTFSANLKLRIKHARGSIPIRVMKQLLNHESVGGVREIPSFLVATEGTIKAWKKELEGHATTVEELSATLKNYETAFNFVGLHEGFHNLSKIKTKELRNFRIAMFVFGILALFPLLGELNYLITHREKLAQMNLIFLVGSGLIMVSLTFFALYFFRICIRSVDSAKSQLLQIELRKTLCQFIQTYATYAGEIRRTNSDVLSKFENVIFSGIVSDTEKLPTTFDGVDQIANLIKAFRDK